MLFGFALLAAPLGTGAQQPGKVPRIGLLFTGPPELSRAVQAFRRGLHELGYVEGQNIALEYRWTEEGRSDQLSGLAADLVRLKVDVIFAQSTSHTLAAKRTTTTIPIVVGAASDAVGSGLVASLARPGGNVTGLSLLAPEVAAKSLELLKEALPKASRVAALRDPDARGTAVSQREVEAAAKVLGIRLQPVDVRHPKDLERAFQAAIATRAQAVITIPGPLFAVHRAQVAELALKGRLPAVSIEWGFAEAGGLMSYGPNIPDNFRRAAVYVDKILKGARPADLPVEQPMRFELVINMKTAKALGITFPQSILIRADQMIQ